MHSEDGQLDKLWMTTEPGFMYDARKTWRRRLAWTHANEPGNHTCFCIFIFPPPKLAHCFATFDRKPWSRNKKVYYMMDGGSAGNMKAPADRPYR